MNCYSHTSEDVLRRPLATGQYTALAFGARCRQAGVRPAMGSVGDCYDSENEASRSGASLTLAETDPVSLR